MADDTPAYNRHLRQRELAFEEKLQAVRRRSVSTPLAPSSGQSGGYDDGGGGGGGSVRSTDDMGDALFEELLHSSPVIRAPGGDRFEEDYEGRHQIGDGDVRDDDDDDADGNSLLETDSDTFGFGGDDDDVGVGGAARGNGDGERGHGEQPRVSDAIKDEFFHDLVATPVDHLTSDRGQLGASPKSPGKFFLFAVVLLCVTCC